jgi:hypothetical protein
MRRGRENAKRRKGLRGIGRVPVVRLIMGLRIHHPGQGVRNRGVR